MIRTLFWVAVWLLSFRLLGVHILYADGLEINLKN